MKLKEWKDNLDKLIKERPEILEMEMIISKDDEGNGFNIVSYTPTIGEWDKDGDFKQETKNNAICLN